MSRIPTTPKQEDKTTVVKAKKQEGVVKPTFQALNPSTHSTVPNHLSNSTIQRLLAQRTGDGPTDLDDATADRINHARGGGQTLDMVIQQKIREGEERD